MNLYRIPKATYNRKVTNQTTNVEIQKTVKCPTCGASAGYYCVTKTNKCSPKYHQKRFDAYIALHRK